MGYTSQQRDVDAGLWYYHARYYDAALGRFLSQDPKGFDSGDDNLYRYVGNSPINGTDPTGMIQAMGTPKYGGASGGQVGGATPVTFRMPDPSYGSSYGSSIGTPFNYGIWVGDTSHEKIASYNRAQSYLNQVTSGYISDASVATKITTTVYGNLTRAGWSAEDARRIVSGSSSVAQQMNMANLEANRYYSRTERLQGSGSIIANTVTFGGTNKLGWTDTSQYHGSTFTGAYIGAGVAREATIMALTMGASSAYAAGRGVAYGVVALGGEGYSTYSNVKGIADGANNLANGNALGALQLAGGAVGLRGNLAAGTKIGSGLLHDYRTLQLNRITNSVAGQVDRAIAAGDVNALRQFGGSLKEAQRAVQVGGGRFRGTIIDLAVKERASNTFGMRSLTYTGRGQYGPDIYNANTMRGWDVTTPGQWNKHVTKYVTNPPPARPQWRTLDPLFTK